MSLAKDGAALMNFFGGGLFLVIHCEHVFNALYNFNICDRIILFSDVDTLVNSFIGSFI